MKETGTLLRNARENKNIQINDVAISTKINVKTLMAMEEGDIENLPPRSFLRGFVQTYAQHLEIDVDSVLEVFQEEMGTSKPSPKITEEAHEDVDFVEPLPKKLPFTRLKLENQTKAFKTTGIALIVALLIGGIISIKRKMDSYQKEEVVSDLPDVVAIPKGDEESPNVSEEERKEQIQPDQDSDVAESSTDPGTPTNNVVDNTEPSPPPVSEPNNSQTESVVKTDAQESPQEETPPSAAQTDPVPEGEEENAEGTTASSDVESIPEESAEDIASAPQPSTQSSRQEQREIVIEALGPVNIQWAADGTTKKITLMPDEIQTIRYSGKLKIQFSDAGAVNISRDGKDLGIPGSLGQTLEKTY